GSEGERRVNGMPVRNQRTEAQPEPLRHGGDRREDREWLHVSAVWIFETVRVEDDVVSNPHGVESVLFDGRRHPHQRLPRCVGTEVGEQQSVLSSHFSPFSYWHF